MRPRTLTDTQIRNLAEWLKEKDRVGSRKAKARELGIKVTTMANYERRIRQGAV